jgi:hypothetical protein
MNPVSDLAIREHRILFALRLRGLQFDEERYNPIMADQVMNKHKQEHPLF